MDFFKKSIVIIGAGISGLACANRLRQLGFYNIFILEARNRVGGRIHAAKLGSSTLQTGAQWIHGQSNNVIYELAESNGLIDKDAFDYYNEIKSLSNFPKKDKDTLKKLFEFLNKQMKHPLKNDVCGASVLSYLEDQLQTFLSDFVPSDHEFFRSGFEWYCKGLLELNGCPSLSLLSRNLHGNYKECEGTANVEIKGGYSSILEIFLNHIPPDWILKNTYVEKIDWSEFKIEQGENQEAVESNLTKNIKKVKVFCKEEKVFLADHVILTTPLGCLKKHYQSFFVPPFCKSKQNAIQYLGFGTINKIYLQFTEPFWKGPAMFLVFRHQAEGLEGWLRCIHRFAYTPGCSDVLCAWIAGEGAVVMESLSEDEVVRGCMQILENILKKKLAMPCRTLRTCWHSDPMACGSYSFLSVDCEKVGVLPSTLAEPVYNSAYGVKHPVLLFAGEATHSCYFSTVHGAYETGVREAERLFHYYRK